MHTTTSLDLGQRLRLGALLLTGGIVALHAVATNPAQGLVRGTYVFGAVLLAVAVQVFVWRTA